MPKPAPAKSTKTDDDYMAQMRSRYSSAKQGWSVVREDARQDIRYCSGDPAQQWDDTIKSNRDDDGIPALTMDSLNPLVSQIVNQARKDRPQPKVEPADGGSPEVADAIEGKMRHALYESHADVAFDCAELYCAVGGFGFYRMTKEWVRNTKPKGKGERGYFVQEPRVRRIPDPMSVLFDPDVQELDYSDARYCFVPKKYDRDLFRKTFKGAEPIEFPFENEEFEDWGDERKVVVAEYWWIEEIPHRLVLLADGTEDIASEIEFDESEVVRERELIERICHCDIVDGEKKLEESIWDIDHIPIYPVVAREMISDGKRRYVSAVRYSRDPAQFINVSMSATAERMSTVNLAPFIGYKGTMKDKKWKDGKRHFYLEAEPTMINGQLAPLPQRNAFEPAIQGSTSATAQGIDALKRAVGYVDSVTRPSQQDLSGSAIEKRDEQANMANFQYEDSLTESMWRFGREFVELLVALSDTPRVWDTRSESGETSKVPITVQVPPDVNPYAPGYEGQPHLQIDDGDYGVVINEGPSLATKSDDEMAIMESLFKSDPALIPIYLPAYFKRRGYADLAEIATAAQPPQIQQALAQAQGKGLPPQMLAQQAQQLQAQNQHLTMILKEVLTKLQTKQIEAEGKIQVQNAKTQGDLAIERLQTVRALIEKSIDHQHDASIHLSDHKHASVEHMLDLFHAAELPRQQAALNPPQPSGETQ